MRINATRVNVPLNLNQKYTHMTSSTYASSNASLQTINLERHLSFTMDTGISRGSVQEHVVRNHWWINRSTAKTVNICRHFSIHGGRTSCFCLNITHIHGEECIKLWNVLMYIVCTSNIHNPLFHIIYIVYHYFFPVSESPLPAYCFQIIHDFINKRTDHTGQFDVKHSLVFMG